MPYVWPGGPPLAALATAALLQPSLAHSMQLPEMDALALLARRLLQDPLYSNSNQRSIMRLPPHVYLIAFVVLVLVMSALLMCHCYRMVRIARAVRSGDHLTAEVIANNIKRGTPPALIQALPVLSVQNAIAQRRRRAATSQASKLAPPPAAALEDEARELEGQQGRQQQQKRQGQLQELELQGAQQDQLWRQQQQGAAAEGSRGLLGALQALNPSKMLAAAAGTAGAAVATGTVEAKEPSFASCHSSSVGHEACAICFDEYDEDEDVKELPCGHFFHPACIDAWLVRDVRCPLCVQPVAPQGQLAAGAPSNTAPTAADGTPATTADAAASSSTAGEAAAAGAAGAAAEGAAAAAGATGTAAAAAPRTVRRRDILLDVLRHPFGGFSQAEEQRALRVLREQDDAERALREAARRERREARRAARAAATAGNGAATAGNGAATAGNGAATAGNGAGGAIGGATGAAAAAGSAGSASNSARGGNIGAASAPTAVASAASGPAGAPRVPAGPVAEGRLVDVELG